VDRIHLSPISCIGKVTEIICQLTIQKISKELNMNRETVKLILMKYLKIKKVCAKIVSKNLINK
jgi:hypothetical protein